MSFIIKTTNCWQEEYFQERRDRTEINILHALVTFKLSESNFDNALLIHLFILTLIGKFVALIG